MTDETHGMVDAAALDRMQDHAVPVNTGRGGLIDEDALATALDDGIIAAAGLAGETPPSYIDPETGCSLL